MLSHSSGFIILAMDHSKLVVANLTVAGLRRTWRRARSKMLAFKQWSRLTRRVECGSTSLGPARGLKFWCERKTQSRRKISSVRQLMTVKTLAETSKLTATLAHRGAGLLSSQTQH